MKTEKGGSMKTEEVETQRRRAKLGVPGEDIAGFKSLPTSSYFEDRLPVLALWGGMACILLGSLYVLDGSNFIGLSFITIGALCAKVVNDA